MIEASEHPVRPAQRSRQAPQRSAHRRPRPRRRAGDAQGDRLHRRRPRAADRRRRHDLDRDDAVQLQPARAGGARQGRASARPAARRWSSTRSRSPTASRWAPRACEASLVSREVIADSIELVARGHMFDGLVCLVGCDKTIPAAAMALARLDLPGLVLYNGSIAPGHVPRPRHHDPGRVRGGRRRTPPAGSTPRSCTRSSRPPAPAPAPAAASSPPTRCRWRSSSWASARPG